MIITNVCLLLEALSIVICLHHLYGEKFRLDIVTVSFLSINMIIMTSINYFELSRICTMIIYPIIIIYCGLRFGFKIKELVINILLCIIIVGGIQLVVSLPFYYFLNIHSFTEIKLLVVNCISFFALLIVVNKVKMKKILSILKNKEKMLQIAISLCMILVFVWLFSYKRFKLLELNQAVLLFASVAFIFVLAGQLSKYKVKAKEAETELKMHKLYSDSFQGLIENIRLRQHEFDNHINTIYSQHYIYHTYEELVEAQKGYCQIVEEDNRFNRLLVSGNSIIIGFLYGKFVEIDKLGIEISYKVNIKEVNIGVPLYKIVEILGDLINNAVEELRETKFGDKLYVCVEESNLFMIEIRNESPYIEHNRIEQFFTKGYSKKGENRGLGLYNVKQICNEYEFHVECENVDIEGINWLSFKIEKEPFTQ